jgi:hypothetical protein
MQTIMNIGRLRPFKDEHSSFIMLGPGRAVASLHVIILQQLLQSF